MQNQQAAQNQTLQGMQAQAAAMQPQPGPSTFQTLDKDKNGELSAEEWQEGVKEFVRLLTQSGPNREYNPAFDLNGDGSIDGLDIEPFTRLFGL